MRSSALITLRRRLLGLAFIACLLGVIVLSVAFYNKTFSTFTRVTLQAGTIGSQLKEQADVKVRGLIVGTVERVEPRLDGAELELALDPAKTHLIPQNVSARLLPKTLFGERYVSLQLPEQPASESLRDGDVISRDRSSTAIELEQALDNLLPVLQAVQPQKLSSTLSAISTALEGRGEPLGQTLVELDQYLTELNPNVPKLTENLRGLADVSDVYNEAAPDFVAALDNLTTTTQTIVDQQGNLNTLYGTVTGTSEDLNSWLVANKDNLINVSTESRKTLEVLERYSPQTPCFLRGMRQAKDKLDLAFGKGTDKPGLHAKIEIVNNRGKYEPGKDEPRYDDHRGPRCYEFEELPDPFPQHPPDGPIQDGSSKPPAAEIADAGVLPPATGSFYDQGGTTSPSSADSGSASLANSGYERDVLATLLSPQLDVAPQDVPGWSGLLVGPLYRGAEVDIK
ncbi:virulence factor Mce-like protein [Tamaricihabitans halophyticus]|uniref:Virulence factor Mce-like protein n=1 Tax=Tamaricihabitans halophyticus TaxID=1262583 RepID=A0A4V2SU42_9PSEU|nr:MCE family protein [Tamaricihabitans halophyticus]TCP53186.1 virulence factor Mce-like protein [Tamaricihabitans halophyticus]